VNDGGGSKSLGSVQFGPFELLLDTQELRKYGQPAKLSGQAIQMMIVPIKLATTAECKARRFAPCCRNSTCSVLVDSRDIQKLVLG